MDVRRVLLVDDLVDTLDELHKLEEEKEREEEKEDETRERFSVFGWFLSVFGVSNTSNVILWKMSP